MCPPSETTDPSAAGPETSLIPSAQLDALKRLCPQSGPSTALLDHVLSVLPLAIVHHSLRVYLFAKWLADKEHDALADSDLLFAAAIGHDLGACRQHSNTSERFEVEGADATVAILTKHGVSAADAHQVWIAIALHTSPHIAERITPLARLVRLGVLIDFRSLSREAYAAVEYGKEIEAKLARLNIEKILGDAVVAQAVQNPAKAPAASWPSNLYKSYLEDPTWTGTNRGF